MEIKINKSKFEEILPVAAEPTGEIFDSFLAQFQQTVDDVVEEMLGDKGVAAVDDGDHSALCNYLLRYCTIRAFREQIAQRDVVLSTTGFGVVSNDQLAPASRDRVQAVNEQLMTDAEMERGHVIGCLTKVDGWGESVQAQFCIQNVIPTLTMLRIFSRQNVSGSKWFDTQYLIDKADVMLREEAGDEVIDHLLLLLRTGSSDEYTLILTYCQKFTLAVVQGDMPSERMWMQRIVQMLEKKVDVYALYAETDAYARRHAEMYENKKEDPCFFM